MSESSAVMAPVPPEERIEAVDILRGLTLLGILVANMAAFGGFSQWPNDWQDPMDKAAQLLIMLLAVGEFYVPFSFLFGWGLALQMERATARGWGATPLILRRLLVLLLFGLIHAVLIWSGDILVIYALLALPLLLLRRLSNRAILVLAVICLLATVVPVLSFFPAYHQIAADLRQAAQVTARHNPYLTGDYLAMVAQRIAEVKSYYTGLAYWGPYILGLFLLGLYAARRGFFQDVAAHRPLFRRLLWVGLLAGLPLTACYVFMTLSPDVMDPDLLPFVRRAARILGGLGLCCFYLSAIVLLAQQEKWRDRLAFLAPAGRMALTNYLMQSIVCTLIFYGYGLRLYGRIGPAIGLIFSIIIFAVQVRLSAWWLDRYRFGPLEWLWRSLTYLKPQPMHPEGDESRMSRRAWSTMAGVVVLILAGIGGWWWLNQRNGPPQVAIQLPQLHAQTPTPRHPDTPTPTPPPTPIATPMVHPAVRTPGPAAARGDLWALGLAFDEEQAFEVIETLTGPPYLGRQTGSSQAHAAGDYIAARFADYGLQPAGVAGTYFQPFPVLYTTLAATPQLVVTGPNGARREYAFRQDFSTVVRYYAGSGTGEGPVIWLPNGTRADYTDVNAVGKVVLCREGGTHEDQARNALEHGAVGLLLLTDPASYPLDRIGPNRDVWVPVPIPVLRVSPTVAQDLLAGSGLTLNDLTVHFAALPLSTTARLAVSLRTEEAAEGRNVLGVLPGRDPAYADQVVIVGGHYDHMGQDPDGRTWAGANDNASGVATLLEIARSWQEQGYVPRRTVLFAAWDAEELGLVGSRYYVAQPHYPLTATVAMLNLDMVGGGDDTLYIEGRDSLVAQLQATAQTLGITTTVADGGRSDHSSFLEAGVPAGLLIWFGLDAAAVPDYHRPSDTPAVIEPPKLAAAGRIANLTALALAEGEPGLRDTLRARAAAVRAGDADAYLRTSSPARQPFDREQFAALRAPAPVRFDLTAVNPVIVGNTATATLRMSAAYVVTANVTTTRAADLPVRFVHTDAGWQVDGPALVWAPTTVDGFPVAHPPGRDVGDLGRVTASRYITLTRQLGRPPDINAALLLYPSQQALWADTTFPAPSEVGVWVSPEGNRYLVKQVYGRPVLTNTLVHLALAGASVTEDTAPWLWRGLPRALDTAANPLAQASYLAQLAGLTELTATVPAEAADWAAVDLLRRRMDWPGIGRLITLLGQGQTPDEALIAVIGYDAAGFEAAWRADWTERLTQARAGLTTTLAARQSAVLAGDEAAFLRTVDPTDPTLLAEERAWFADLQAHPESLALAGRLLAVFDDGSLLAEVTTRYRLAETREIIRLTPNRRATGEYRWAGPPFETLLGEGVTVHYPAGQAALAQVVLAEAAAARARLAAELPFSTVGRLTIKLYTDGRAFRSGIRLSLPDWIETWTGPGESVKLLAAPLNDPASRRRVVAREVARWLLFGRDIQPEWFREGLALVAVGRLDAADARQIAARYRPVVTVAAQRGRLFPLADMPARIALSQTDRELADAQAWDAVRYLAETYGWARLEAIGRDLERGQSMDEALRAALGRSLAAFEAEWRASAARGHADPAWVDVAWRFDEDRANDHVVELAGPAYAGRPAGSPGDRAAAQYIADRLAAAGLVPLGDDGTYFQQFPISYTVLLDTPSLTLTAPRQQTQTVLTYRQDFLAVLREGAGGGAVEGAVVWVRDPDYAGMQLDGKIVLRRPATGLADEIRRAVEHGAGGLILVGERDENRLWAKDSYPVTPPAPPIGGERGGIPVLELSEAGLSRLLAAGGHSLTEINNSPPALPLNLRARLVVPLSPPVTVSTTNVLGLLPGADPALRHEVIILGAHHDHVGDDPDGTRYPGANDDASGVGVLLEIARLWQETGYRPARSILFAAWGAQEAGEVGSSYYVAHPVVPLTDTVAVFQLDAVGGGFAGFRLQVQGSSQRESWLIWAMETAAESVEGRLIRSKVTGRSDQRPFQEAGIPALLLTWTNASEDNLPASRADVVEPYKLGVTGRTVTLALMLLAGGDVGSLR